MDISASGGLGVCASENGKTWVWDPDDGETRVINPFTTDIRTLTLTQSTHFV